MTENTQLIECDARPRDAREGGGEYENKEKANMKKRDRLRRLLALPALVLGFACAQVNAGGKYSSYITGVTLKGLNGLPISAGEDGDGDLWFTTWADDGKLYGTWSDGNGPNKGQNGCAYWTSLGVVRHAGAIGPKTVVTELWRLDPVNPKCPRYSDAEKMKSGSILSIEGTLYASFQTTHPNCGVHCTDSGFLAMSTDRGKTWTDDRAASPWTYNGPADPYDVWHPGSSPFRCLMLFNMGRDYVLNNDGYVYGFGIGMSYGWEPRTVFLARVPAEKIMNYGAWRYYTGTGWSPDQYAAQPIANIEAWEQGSVIWHAGVQRYLFLTQTKLYESKHPWGPWFEVNTHGVWGVPGSGWWGYQPGIISKGAGAKSFWFTFAGQPPLGFDVGYNLHYGRMVMILSGKTAEE
ncbi:MAG: DUF4185 domain-containing protein [Acidobacteria bacterium]|nr:DUF4185 domain-containing protein [Acidobacteriota bacterium]